MMRTSMEPRARFTLQVALAFMTAGWLAAATAWSQPLKVVAWNLEWFPGASPTPTPEEEVAQMKAAQKALRAIDPDIFIAQEVRDWQAFDELVSAAPNLRTHVVSSFRSAQTREIQRQQIGIASNLKCRGAWWNEFKVLVPRASRGYSFVALEHPENGKLIMVYGVHLKSNRGGDSDYLAQINGAARNDQARQLIASMGDAAQAFAGFEVAGWIIGGDINTNHDGDFPHCRVVQILENVGFHNTWRGVPLKDRLTWRGAPDLPFDPSTLDYFFLSGFGNRIRADIVAVPREISDHHPIRIEIP